jgi:hypothetical protein
VKEKEREDFDYGCVHLVVCFRDSEKTMVAIDFFATLLSFQLSLPDTVNHFEMPLPNALSLSLSSPFLSVPKSQLAPGLPVAEFIAKCTKYAFLQTVHARFLSVGAKL